MTYFRIVCGFAFLSAAGVLCALVPPDAGSSREAFYYHFDRADRQTDPSLWMREARLGREAALQNWERTAFELSGHPEWGEETLAELSLWSEEELERRFGQWLFRRFLGEGSADLTGILAGAVETANRTWAYHATPEGGVSYNPETGDPEIVRPWEGAGLELDVQAWRAYVLGEAETGFTSYADALYSRFPEILSYLPEERRGEFRVRLEGLAFETLAGRNAELGALIAREERLFVARRTGDLWSLRRQSEQESAQAITARLLGEASAVCALGIASLEERVEAARAGTGDLALAGADWLDAFREQFERGIKAWENAEENFLVRRMEWERDSGEYFLAGQEAWESAFTRMEQERLAWEEKARELFLAGEKLFAGASEQLGRSIAEAKSEFERDAELRIQSGVQRAGAWVDMYVTCGSVLVESKESANFWLIRFVDQKPPANALENGTLGNWAAGILASGKSLTANQKTAGQELVRWSALYTLYRDKAAEAKSILEREFGLALALDSGPLSGITGLDSGGFFLDEYQIELLRAQAAAGYWEQRLAIAEATASYAADLTAGRMTQAESLALWKEAKSAYDMALGLYGEARETLSAVGTSAAEAGERMRQASAALAEAERELEELNSQYALQMAAYRLNSGDFILEELGAYYASLVESYKSKNADGYYTAYLAASRDYSDTVRFSEGQALLEQTAAINNNAEREMRLILLHVETAPDWYFAVSGINGNDEARKALAEEGLLVRLIREAGNNERSALMLKVYRELEPYSRAAQKEAVYAALGGIENIFAGYGLSSGQGHFPQAYLAAQALFDTCLEDNLDIGEAAADLMIRIGQETKIFPEWIEKELESWKEALISFIGAKAAYDGAQANGTAAEAASLYEEFSQEAYRLYSLGENSTELSREASRQYYLYLYFAAYEKVVREHSGANEAEHWRTYITSPFIDGYNLKKNDGSKLPGGISVESDQTGVRGALSQAEGILADAWEKAEDERSKLENAFAFFGQAGAGALEAAFARTAGELLDGSGTAQNFVFDEYALEIAFEFYKNENEKLHERLRNETFMQGEILRLGYGYESLPGREVTAAHMDRLSSALDALRLGYELKLEQYKNAAEDFASAGTVYENLYTETKNSFYAAEQARLEYEKQDAVQRWASTAYLRQSSKGQLNTEYYREPEEEVMYVRERNLRAKAAFQALQNLYTDGEEKRPYDDPGYNKMYAEYQASFTRMFLALKAKEETEKRMSAEKSNNAALYASLSSHAASFLNPELYVYLENVAESAASGGIPPDVPNGINGGAWFQYLHVDEQGRLSLSYDPVTYKLTALDAEDAASFADYFKSGLWTGNGDNQASAFEHALAEWTVRMGSYNLRDSGVFQQWGLALDYLIRTLIKHNPEVDGINKNYTLSDLRENGNMVLGWSTTLNEWLRKYREGTSLYGVSLGSPLEDAQAKAWNTLGEQGRKDAQFLLALFLSGGMENASGLSLASELKELNWLYDKTDSYQYTIKLFFIKLVVYKLPYTLDQSELNASKNVVKRYRNDVAASINRSRNNLYQDMSGLSKIWEDYLASCETLKALSGLKETDEKTAWTDLEKAMMTLDIFSGEEIGIMEGCWNEMLAREQMQGKSPEYTNNASALESLMVWTKGMRNGIKENFETAYQEDEISRAGFEQNYRLSFDSYINGMCSLEELTAAAEAAYGGASPSLKNHLENLGSAMLSDLAKITGEKSEYSAYYRTLSSEYTALIQRVYHERCAAELSSREFEWAEKMRDLNEKALAWREASALVLERGRAEWKTGAESMRDAYTRWMSDFAEEYDRISGAWDAAYLESLSEKESWINRAIEAADNAYTGALLSFVGSDAEALGRKLDTFIPSNVYNRNSLDEAGAALNRLLGSAGITNLETAFSALSGSASTVSTQARAGISGIGVWNAGLVYAAAKELANRGTSDMAAGKMALLAFRARETAMESKYALKERIDTSNKKFDSSMDETFGMGGGWSRSGAQYVRDVIVHSTMFQSVITERVVLAAYRWYIMEAWDFVTDLSDTYLEGLDYLGIQALIAEAQKEVQEKSVLVFGSNERNGELDKWIGSGAVMEKGKVVNLGSGEQGRLLTEYYKWSAQQANGIALVNAPAWDKPLWDSRGSWFDAPSLRNVADIGLTLVSTAIFPGGSLLAGVILNLADDALFAGMDVAFGYKSWDKAGFAFGQKALMAAASSAVGTIFTGAGTAAGGSGFFAGDGLGAYADTLAAGQGFAKTALQGTLTGMQTLTSGVITSAIGGLSYSRDVGFGWSGDTFTNGLRGTLTGAAVGSVSTFTSGLLNMGLEGFYGSYYENGVKLSSLAGGAAGQGLNYAFGGDIALNPVNLGFLDNNLSRNGLLELHFGREGFNAVLGTGGLDVSAGTLIGAAQGLEAWKVNFEIWNSDAPAAGKYASQMRTLYSGSEIEKQAYEAILTGSTRIYENKNTGYTETKYDPVTGYKNILLGDDILDDTSRFGLNVVFSHEAYRNGIDDGEEGQRQETALAINGHIGAALGLMKNYGISSIGQDMACEALGFSKNYNTFTSPESSGMETQEMRLGGIVNGYDSSADYWRFTSEGRIIFDGSHNLYNEDGGLLKEAEGFTSYIKSLAYVLNISGEEARLMMSGFEWKKGTFMKDGVDIKNNTAINTSIAVKTNYFIQRDYVNNVFTKFKGDMILAMKTARKDFTSSSLYAHSGGGFNSVLPGFFDTYDQYARLWMDTMHGYIKDSKLYDGLWGFTRKNEAEVNEAYKQIANNWANDDSNPMYEFVGEGKVINPVGGTSVITTKSAYTDGTFHGVKTGTAGSEKTIGLAIDIATYGKNLPVYTTQSETLLLQNNPLRWQNANNSSAGYGYHLRTMTDDFFKVYGHMTENSQASQRLASLISAGARAGIYTLTLPPGFNFGNVGSTGYSTGEHLHFELRPRFWL
jgi:hypothetical protein